MTVLDSILAFERSQAHLQSKVLLVRGKLGLPDGTVSGSRGGYDWVRLRGLSNQPVQAYNDKTKHTHNLDVYVAVDPYRTEGLAPYTVMGTVGSVGTSMSALLDEKSKFEENVGQLARALEWGSNLGRDALNVFDRAIVPLRVQAFEDARMQVYANPGYYTYRGTYQFYLGGSTPVITSPVAGTRTDLVYLDAAANTIGVTAGVVATDVYSVPAVPNLGVGQIPLAHLLLGANTTEINERNIFDMRPFIAADGVPWLQGAAGDTLVNDGAGGAGWSAPQRWVFGYWTSTAWDGDNKDSSGEIIDLSTAFGMSTVAKAVLVSLTIKDASANVWATLSKNSSEIDQGIAAAYTGPQRVREN